MNYVSWGHWHAYFFSSTILISNLTFNFIILSPNCYFLWNFLFRIFFIIIFIWVRLTPALFLYNWSYRFISSAFSFIFYWVIKWCFNYVRPLVFYIRLVNIIFIINMVSGCVWKIAALIIIELISNIHLIFKIILYLVYSLKYWCVKYPLWEKGNKQHSKKKYRLF